MSKKWLSYTIWGALFLLGLIIRLHVIWQTDLWFDEYLSVRIAQKTSITDLFFQAGTYTDYVHPSYYYLFLKAWVWMFSSAEHSLRASSLFFFVPSVLLLMLYVRKIFREPFAQYFAVLGFCVHPLLVSLSVQVRMYSITVCFALATLLLIEWAMEKRTMVYTLAASLALTVSLYLDYSAVWLFGYVGVLGAFQYLRKDKRAYIMGQIMMLVSVLYFPQLIVWLRAVAAGQGIAPGSVPQGGEKWVFFAQEIQKLLGVLHQPIFGAALGLSVLVLALGMLGRRKQLSVLFLFPLIASLSFSMIGTPIFLARHVFLSAIGVVLLIGQSVECTHEHVKNMRMVVVAAYASILLFGSIMLLGMNYTQNIESASARLSVERRTPIVLWSLNAPVYLEYYFPQAGVDPRRAFILHRLDQVEDLVRLKDQSYVVFYPRWCTEQESCSDLRIAVERELCADQECEWVSE